MCGPTRLGSRVTQICCGQMPTISELMAELPTKETPEKMGTDDPVWRSKMQSVSGLAEAYASKTLHGAIPVQSKASYDGLHGKDSTTFICDKSFTGGNKRKSGAVGVKFGSRGTLTAIDDPVFTHVYTVRSRTPDKMRAYRFERIQTQLSSTGTFSTDEFDERDYTHIVHVVNDMGGTKEVAREAAAQAAISAATHAGASSVLLLQSAPIIMDDNLLSTHTDAGQLGALLDDGQQFAFPATI